MWLSRLILTWWHTKSKRKKISEVKFLNLNKYTFFCSFAFVYQMIYRILLYCNISCQIARVREFSIFIPYWFPSWRVIPAILEITKDCHNIREEVTIWSFKMTLINSEVVVQRCSVKKVFLEILQNLHENTCDRVSFSIELQASGLQLY